MKFLETLNSSPHESFPTLSGEYLHKYIDEEFEYTIKDISRLKDLINHFSHILVGQPSYNPYPEYTFKIPVNKDILNVAVALYIKLETRFLRNKKIRVRDSSFKEDIKREEFLEDMLNISYQDITYKHINNKMNSIGDIVLANPVQRIYPNFMYKVITKKHRVLKTFKTLENVGYLYIDSTASMGKNIKLIESVVSYIKQYSKEIKIHVYSVHFNSIKFIGISTGKEDIIKVINKVFFLPGVIEYDSVIKHSNSHEYKSTFITDAEDFDTEEFINNTNKFNLITLGNGGKIINIK